MTTVNGDGEVAGPPLIGISIYCERARWRIWESDAFVLPRRYADRVTAAGGIPVLLPPVPGVEEALRGLDGLLLSGGGDIDPARYGASAAQQTANVGHERDAAEFALFGAAMSLGLPVLGICRGLQVINVARGGTLHQHLPDVVAHDGHAPVPGAFGAHAVRVAPGSRVGQIVGSDENGPLAVAPTHHHQSIDGLGSGLTATAWAEDGVVEAAELDPAEAPFVIGVQWHPEAGDDLSLFRALTAAARDRAATPSDRAAPPTDRVPIPSDRASTPA
jgi:putative glutamine amidotransferase